VIDSPSLVPRQVCALLILLDGFSRQNYLREKVDVNFNVPRQAGSFQTAGGEFGRALFFLLSSTARPRLFSRFVAFIIAVENREAARLR